jgi:hypothetical protein
MKHLLTALFDFACGRVRHTNAFHDDTIRANQGSESSTFRPWRTFFGA